MTLRIAINGFGRIGRLVLRAARTADDIQIVAVNDLADAKTLGHLLKSDSVHGTFPAEVVVKGDEITVDGQTIRALATKDLDAARVELARSNGLAVDYVEVADFDPPVLAAAIRIGSTRLIDNVVLEGEAR